MIVGDSCLKENTTFISRVFIVIVRIFIRVGTVATAFYNQTTLYITTKQTVSPLLLFHVNRASERNVIPAVERHPVSNSVVQSEVKVHKIFSQARDV